MNLPTVHTSPLTSSRLEFPVSGVLHPIVIFTKVGDFPVDSLIHQPPLDPGLVGVLLDYVELRFFAVIFVSILVTWVVLCAETLYLWS